MSRKPLWLTAGAAAVLLLLAGVAIRVQPRGEARIVRRGNDLTVIAGRIGWGVPGGSVCLAPSVGDALRFRERYDVEDALGETINVEVTFDYAPPRGVPAGWGDGSWCAVLRNRVQQSVTRGLSAVSVDRLRSDPRGAGDAAQAVVERELRGSGVQPRLLAVRPRVSETARKTLPVPEIASRAVKAPPVIFIGLDGADWQLLDRYIAAGAMPNLASLVREGASGSLRTQHPALSPLLWTSMMTGASPLDHEILDFTRFNPTTGTKEPITSDERAVPAIWNMATQSGKSTAVFALWATYPAEPVRGMLISDRFFTFLFSEASPPPGVVYPPSREAWARTILNQVTAEVGYEAVKKYLPWLTQEEYGERATSENPYAHPITALRRVLIETGVYDRLAREYLRTRTPDLTVLYMQGTDTVGHVFAPYMAPRLPNITPTDFERYTNVPELYFRHIDTILGRYRDLARERGARLMLASDHGFHWFEGRPTELSSFAAATAAKWHRADGIYLLWGEGIAPSRQRGEASPPRIAQVCATLAALSGMPQPAGVDGSPIAPVRPVAATADYRPRYERVAAPAVLTNATATAEEIAKLKALGYVGAGESMARPASAGRSTRTAGWYNNRGLILKDQKKIADSIDSFEKAIELDPNLPSALWNLSDLLYAENRDTTRSDELLVRATANGLPEGNKILIGRAIGYQRNGDVKRSFRLLDGVVRAKPDDAELRMFRGRYRIELQDCAGALEDFQTVQRISPENPVGHASAGIALMCLGRQAEAAQSFRRSLAIDPNQPRLRQYLQQGL